MLKKTGAFFFLVSFVLHAIAQQVIWKDDFESGGGNWNLNATDAIHGKACTSIDNKWEINNKYAGNNAFFIPNTNAQPLGITNQPYSNYLHILSPTIVTGLGIENAHYVWLNKTREQNMAKMASGVNTVGFSNVGFRFWWLNYSNPDTTGQVFYSTNGGTTWVKTPVTYQQDSIWKQSVIQLPAFDNQPDLRFAYVFINPDTGWPPGFAVDEVEIFGTPAGLPTANFSGSPLTLCKDSCVQFFDASSNSPNRWHWNFGTGNPADTSNLKNPKFCYTTAGSFSVTLTAYNGAGASSPNSKINYITVIDCNQPPTPDFTMSQTTICAGDSVTYTDVSAGIINSRYWAFQGAADTAGICRIINDSLPSVTLWYPCAGSRGRDTTYTSVLNVAGPGGSRPLVKNLTVKACIPAVARIKDGSIQRKKCKGDCEKYVYDRAVEDELFITAKPTVTWYIYDDKKNLIKTQVSDTYILQCFPKAGLYDIGIVAENIYGRDSLYYKEISSVMDYPVVMVDETPKTIIADYSVLLNTVDGDNPIYCNLLTEKDKFNGDTTWCHNYFWSYKTDNNEFLKDDIDDWTKENTRARPSEPKWYYIIKENYNQCRSFDSVYVEIREFYNVGVPDIIYPGGGSDRNKAFYIFGNGIGKIDVKIYNRYGQLVFESEDMDLMMRESDKPPHGSTKGWTGDLKNEIGKECEPGVYTYYVKVWHIDGEYKELKGNVTLIR
jgi:PKD repeat protein